VPFVSDAQREYLRRNEPAVYREFQRAEDRGELDLKPPATVAAAARRGLELRAEYRRGGTAVGVARARDLGNRRTLTIETVKRMLAYFTRHEIDLEAPAAKRGNPGYPSAGYIAWLLWGGDAGRTWARKIIRQEARVRAALERKKEEA
jgi:hypothetical protein